MSFDSLSFYLLIFNFCENEIIRRKVCSLFYNLFTFAFHCVDIRIKSFRVIAFNITQFNDLFLSRFLCTLVLSHFHKFRLSEKYFPAPIVLRFFTHPPRPLLLIEFFKLLTVGSRAIDIIFFVFSRGYTTFRLSEQHLRWYPGRIVLV